jgi:hypothetical protein
MHEPQPNSRHSGESQNPGCNLIRRIFIQDATHRITYWIPAFAGMTAWWRYFVISGNHRDGDTSASPILTPATPHASDHIAL